jgi:hypothetical protein
MSVTVEALAGNVEISATAEVTIAKKKDRRWISRAMGAALSSLKQFIN